MILFSIYSLVFVSIVYQTLETVFHLISKHLEFRQKYSAVHCIFNSLLNLVPRVLVTLVHGGMGNKDLWEEAICHACVRLNVSTNGNQDSWSSGVTAQVRWITLSQRSLLLVPPLDKGNEDSGNEIALFLVFALLRSVIGLKNSRHLLNQSDAKPKPIMVLVLVLVLRHSNENRSN